MALFRQLVYKPFAEERWAGAGACQMEEICDQVALALLLECLGYVHHEFGREVG